MCHSGMWAASRPGVNYMEGLLPSLDKVALAVLLWFHTNVSIAGSSFVVNAAGI